MRPAAVLLAVSLLAAPALGAALGTSARASIPADVQQIITVDYRSLKDSPTAMALKQRVLPENLKQFEAALRQFGLDPDRDLDQLAFVSFRSRGALRIIGIGQGQLPTAQVLRRMTARRIKPIRHRDLSLYPAGGLQMTFLDPATMVFGDAEALRAALDARDGEIASLNSNSQITDLMSGIENNAVWSVLDTDGTQNMMRSALGDAARLADYDAVRKRMIASRYTLDFARGVSFNLDVFTPDSFTASGLSALVRAGMMYRRLSASGPEKDLIEKLDVNSDSDKLRLRLRTDDKSFQSFLQTDLFAAVSH